MIRDGHAPGRGGPAAQAPPGEGRGAEPDYKALKAGGMVRQRQKDRFTVRLKCPGGRVPLERLARIAEVARRRGADYVHLSVRQSIEIPYVLAQDLAKVREELAEVGQEIASCGARVRVPTACSGCEYNPNGLTDTQKMAADVAARFFGRGPFAHKFKMSFSGCPIDCARTSENDLGFQGAVEPRWDESACTACGLCAAACREGAIELAAGTNKPRYRRDKCLFCGDCIRACPVDAWQAQRTGWMVRVGGKHGRHPIVGARIAAMLPDANVSGLIEAVISWYEKNAAGKGRIRLGALLQDPAAWRRFLADIGPVLGEWAAPDPAPPRPCEIHF